MGMNRQVLADLAARAEVEGLLDVAYATVDSPFGRLLVAGTPQGLVRLGFATEDRDGVLDELARRISPRVLEAPARLDTVRRELDEYFDGRRHEFELELDLRFVPAYHRQVLDELARVEYGRTTTYGALAALTGKPRAARAVGTVMNRNPIPIVLPCHRVIGASGSLTGYGGGLDRKELLLRLEGAIL
jgi:methylated-DNA-[protein]-cysteine S-methyltransferase